ncbi:MAG: hypothetical protein IH991_19655, partial [Planctomycetes bacterium]|nr:hypothetical protein [Planctomycetota bacterium]
TNATDNAAATLSSQRAALLASAIVQYDSPNSDSSSSDRRLTSSLTSASDSSETSDLESLLSEIAGDVEEAQQSDTAHEAFFANFFDN